MYLERRYLYWDRVLVAETRLKLLKPREISFAHNLFRSAKSFRNWYSNTAVHCAKYQNDSTTDLKVMVEQHLVRFEFNSMLSSDAYVT